MGTMDYILDTISAVHPLDPLIRLLNLNGKLVAVGLPNKPVELSIGILASGEPKLIFLVSKGTWKKTRIRNEKLELVFEICIQF